MDGWMGDQEEEDSWLVPEIQTLTQAHSFECRLGINRRSLSPASCCSGVNESEFSPQFELIAFVFSNFVLKVTTGASSSWAYRG